MTFRKLIVGIVVFAFVSTFVFNIIEDFQYKYFRSEGNMAQVGQSYLVDGKDKIEEVDEYLDEIIIYSNTKEKIKDKISTRKMKKELEEIEEVEGVEEGFSKAPPSEVQDSISSSLSTLTDLSRVKVEELVGRRLTDAEWESGVVMIGGTPQILPKGDGKSTNRPVVEKQIKEDVNNALKEESIIGKVKGTVKDKIKGKLFEFIEGIFD